MENPAAKRSITNVLWAYTSFLSTKVLNLVAIIIVARYLGPAEFGLMAICLSLMVYFDILAQFGLGSALISSRDDVEETASAVLACGLAFSCVLAGLLWLGSGAIATFYGEAILRDLLRVIALALVVRSLTMVNDALLFRELRFRARVVPDVVRGLTKGLVTIGLAVSGFEVWALVYGYLASAVAGSLALVVMRPWYPTRRPTRDSARYVLGYGSNLLGAESINAVPRILDNLLIGKVLGPAALGLYSLAFRIPELGIKTFTSVTGSVLHPVMSTIQNDPAALRDYYYGALRYCALIMFGVGGAIAILAEPVVRVLYTPEWYGMVVPMQLIAVAFAIGTLNMVPGKLLKAVRRTDLLFRVSLMNLPFFVVLIWLSVPYGIVAVSWIQVLLAVLRFLPTYWITKRVMDVNAADTLSALLPGATCAGAASVAALWSLQVEASALGSLLLGAGVYAATYLVVVRLTVPEAVTTVVELLGRRRRVA